jgi:hypothetical protein
MATVEHYRKQAARCRQLAADKPFASHVERWRVMANNYDMLADSEEKRRSANLQQILQRLEGQRQPP